MNKNLASTKSKTTNSPTIARQAQKVIMKRSRRKNPNDDICNERRQELLELILKTNSIRRAANELGINNSTAKSIFYKYKQTGQILKNPRLRNKDGNGPSEHESMDDCVLADDDSVPDP
jgi:DNA invertase Pin-like site-specific DNA recombinase